MLRKLFNSRAKGGPDFCGGLKEQGGNCGKTFCWDSNVVEGENSGKGGKYKGLECPRSVFV